MTEFWKNLDWPDLIDALPLVQQLTEDTCGGAVLYADLVHEKLRKAGYYDEDGQFDVTEQVDVYFTSLYHRLASCKRYFVLSTNIFKTPLH